MLTIITCQYATLLIEQRADQPLSAPEHTALADHLRTCPPCERYAGQSPQLARLAHCAARYLADRVDLRLPEAARTRIQHRLDAALK